MKKINYGVLWGVSLAIVYFSTGLADDKPPFFEQPALAELNNNGGSTPHPFLQDGFIVSPDYDPNLPFLVNANWYQSEVDIAFDGETYLLVWADGRFRHKTFGADIFGARLSKTGELLDPAVLFR